jgi:hypothetical protein
MPLRGTRSAPTQFRVNVRRHEEDNASPNAELSANIVRENPEIQSSITQTLDDMDLADLRAELRRARRMRERVAREGSVRGDARTRSRE